MNDNRTNEPSEAQVEAAAKALEKIPFMAFGMVTRSDARVLARAALVAAQGAGKEKNDE